jgi:hypothetical protein
MITQERLKELLHYDSDTGFFTWKPRERIGKNKPWTRLLAEKQAGVIHKRQGYVFIRIDNKLYLAHRLAVLYMTGKFPDNMTDHIDGIRSNNKWNNLREACNSENMQNLKKARIDNKSTGLLGAHFNKRQNKFSSSIQTNKKQKHLGYFSSAIEAHEAYLKAKRELHSHNTL